MSKDNIVIFNYVSNMSKLHNLIGELDTLPYDNVYFLQSKIRKRIKDVEEELGIKVEDITGIRLNIAKGTDIKYLRVEE